VRAALAPSDRSLRADGCCTGFATDPPIRAWTGNVVVEHECGAATGAWCSTAT
jgi:hypothetical protein